MQGISRIALLAALVGSGPAMAQGTEDPVLLGTITLTASTEAVALGRTGSSVTVLTREDIDRAGTLSFGQLAAMQPGVSFSASGGMGTQSTLRLRGVASYYVGSRLDGFDVTDTAGVQFAFNFNGLATAGLDRVEILRGSQSALYGSEAIGGVIDVTTFRPTENGTSGRLAVEAGSDGAASGTVAAGLLTDQLELAFTASRSVTENGISARAGGVENDGYRGSMVTAYAAYRLNDALRVGANLLWRKTFAEYDDSATAELGTYQDGVQRGARAFVELSLGSLTHELSVSRLTNERLEMSGFGPGYFDGSRNQIAYLGGWEATSALSVNWGLDYTREAFATSYGEAGKSETRSVFAEGLLAVDDTLDLSLALRHSDHDIFGGKVTGRAALAWRPVEDWTIRAVAATGFRAPSLYELYSGSGDRNLKPETSRSLELGVQRDFGAESFVQATLFDTRIEDRIDYSAAATACGSSWGCYAQIDGRTVSRGVEVAGRAALLSGWAVFGNYTYTDSEDRKATGTSRAERMPRHSLTLGVEGEIIDRLNGSLLLRHVADSYELAGALPDYTLVDAALRYQISDAAEAYFRIENLTDESYQTAYGYSQPGRQVFVGVRTSF